MSAGLYLDEGWYGFKIKHSRYNESRVGVAEVLSARDRHLQRLQQLDYGDFSIFSFVNCPQKLRILFVFENGLANKNYAQPGTVLTVMHGRAVSLTARPRYRRIVVRSPRPHQASDM